MPLKKPLQPGTPNDQPTTYPVNLRDLWPQSEKPGPPGKEPIHQIADEYLTKQAISLNLHSMKCRTHPLLPTFLTLKEMIIIFGNQSKIKKTQTSLPPIRKYSIPPGPWAKSDKEKADLFAEHLSEVFSPNNNDQDQDVERELATHTHNHRKTFKPPLYGK